MINIYMNRLLFAILLFLMGCAHYGKNNANDEWMVVYSYEPYIASTSSACIRVLKADYLAPSIVLSYGGSCSYRIINDEHEMAEFVDSFLADNPRVNVDQFFEALIPYIRAQLLYRSGDLLLNYRAYEKLKLKWPNAMSMFDADEFQESANGSFYSISEFGKIKLHNISINKDTRKLSIACDVVDNLPSFDGYDFFDLISYRSSRICVNRRPG